MSKQNKVPQRYSDKQIEEACEALQICAANRAEYYSGSRNEVTLISLGELIKYPVLSLAASAYIAAQGYNRSIAEQYAEAESWIRCGWRANDDELNFELIG